MSTGIQGRVIALALTCLIAASAHGRTPPVDKSLTDVQAYQAARKAFGEGRYDEALGLLRHAHMRSPKPIYLFNIGRTLESLGQTQEAHAAFLTVAAMDRTPGELRALAKARAAKLQPLLGQAQFVFTGLTAHTIVMLDDQAVDATKAVEVAAGAHQICRIDSKQGRVACWRRELKGGVRLTLPDPAGASTRGSLAWPPRTGGERLKINGHPIAVDVARLQMLELDAGAHKLTVSWRDGRSRELEIDVLPRTVRELVLTAPDAPRDVEIAKPVDPPAAGRSAWPWVVSGTGIATLGAGVALLVVGGGARADPDINDRTGLVKSLTQTGHQDDWEASRTHSTAGIVLTIAGSAAVVGGLAWLVLSSDGAPAPAPEPAVSVSVSPDGWVLVGGRF